MQDCREPTVFFLIGAERSGTTLLRLMLDHHTGISCGGEFNYVTAHLIDGVHEPSPRQFKGALRLNRQFVFSGLAYDPTLERSSTGVGDESPIDSAAREPAAGARRPADRADGLCESDSRDGRRGFRQGCQ